MRNHGIAQRLYLNDEVIKMIPRWENFKHFFQITIFRYLVVWFSLVPVLAKLFEPLPEELKLQTANNVFFVLNLSLPFNWQLLWLSSLFFLAAWIVYIFRCPNFIKKYNQYGEYLSYGHDSRWIVWESRELFEIKWFSKGKNLAVLVDRLFTKKYLKIIEASDIPLGIKYNEPNVNEKQTEIFFKSDGKVYRFAMPIIENDMNTPETERGVFWEIFARFSGSRTYSRVLICILLGISTLFFLYVFGQHIIEGMRYVNTWLHPIQISSS